MTIFRGRVARRVLRVVKTQSLGALALFIALGGTGYAAVTGSIDSREVKNNSIQGKDVKNGSLEGRDVKNGSLTADDVKNGLPSGPAGAQGTTGPQGPQGTAGTARAYAYVNPSTCAGGPPAVCTVSHTKGVTSVTRAATGIYCVTVPGLNPASTPPVISPGQYEDTNLLAGLSSAIWATGFVNACTPSQYQVYTQTVNSVYVRNSTDNGIADVADNSDTASNDVPFVITIP